MRRAWLRSGEHLLWLLGALFLTLAGYNLCCYYAFQCGFWDAASNIAVTSAATSGPENRLPAGKLLLAREPNGRVGSLQISSRLEIPRLGVSVLVVDGGEDEGLSVAAVHLGGTPEPGSTGNAVIAGHRDTAFWPLRRLKVGDLIRIRNPKAHRYLVRSIRIVEPDDISVLENGPGSTLTLVTCYPFRFLGSAPQRFVVRAQLVS